ncbi:DUF2125 domain-containing protein [Psychromarinibacter sp. C21-152]|uniref:DUF2125 domain-containing protein n=1 Tax=Psychromarinibacter sediminicola TaxID=3033385 RepID=A0AAE3T9V0_9RHOB|nr:DUF2125 domain-containing protein [Psychromarinibacter sediminicola]MDF0603020.1 DUF2125 domain-containing protein [Psychromarinibacter sediminicola]
MRLLIGALLVAAAAWSGWWWIGSGREVAAIRDWIGRTDGARADAVSIAGFPNRFDTRIAAPELRIGNVTWSAPVLELMRLSYRPGHYIVAVADSQTLATPAQTVDMETERARASVVYTDGAPDRLSVVIDALRLSSSAGWSARAETLLIAARGSGAEGTELGLDVTALRGPDGPAIALHAEGVLTPDASGRPAGTLRLHSTDWPATLDLLSRTGLIPPRTADALAPLAQPDDPLTLTLTGGRITVADEDMGPLPLFALPR